MVPGATDIRDAVRASYAAQREAMVAGDADALGALLAEDFTLVHMTGYRQPRGEWLADVRSGAMSYRSMEDVDVSVDMSGEALRDRIEANLARQSVPELSAIRLVRARSDLSSAMPRFVTAFLEAELPV